MSPSSRGNSIIVGSAAAGLPKAISAITPMTATTLRLIAYFPIESKRISRAALTSCPAQAREQQLAMLRNAPGHRARHDLQGDRAQFFHGFTRLRHALHMRVASGENAVDRRRAGIFLDREEQFRGCILEAALEEVSEADYYQRRADPFARAETHRGLDMLYCSIQVTGIQAQQAADVPAARE